MMKQVYDAVRLATVMLMAVLAVPVLAEEPRPVAVAPAPAFDFGTVLDGREVVTTYALRNTGNAELRIEEVSTGCGCTEAGYDRSITAGGEGKITIRLDTTGYGGKRIQQSIKVRTNDPVTPETELRIGGMVDRFAEIRPERVRISGPVGTDLTQTVDIMVGEKYPFSITGVSTEGKGNIDVSFVEDASKGPKIYRLTVKNLKTTAARYSDAIHVATDSTINPEFVIRVYGFIADVAPASGKSS